jgi:GAF domain-containing protein
MRSPSALEVAGGRLGSLEASSELEIRLPAALLERFTSLLVANPPLPLLVEETYFGLEALFDLDFLLLYTLEDETLRPISGAGRGEFEVLVEDLQPIPRASDGLWQAVESGVACFVSDAVTAPLSADLNFLRTPNQAVLPLPGENGAVRGALVIGRLEATQGWAVARQKTLVAASRVVAVCLERNLSLHPESSSEGIALSNLARLLDGVHSEAQLRRAALEVLRPHLAGVSLTWARLERSGLQLLEFDGNETLETHLRESELPDDDEILEAVLEDHVICGKSLSGTGRFAALNVSAWCAMPIRQSLVLLALRQSRQSAWTDAEERLLGAAGKTLTAALERLQALEALMDARARAEFLAGLSDALQSAMTAEEVCTTAMSLLGPNVRASNIITLRLSHSEGAIRVTAMGVWGEVPVLYSNHLRPEGVPLEMTKLTRRVFETRQPFYDRGYVREKDPERSKVALGLEPIFDSAGNVLAVFSVGRDPRLGDWKPSERELLFRAAATVGLALERAQVRLELEESRHRAQVLAKLSDALQTAQTAEDSAQYAMDLLAPALKALNIITLKLERREGGVFLRSMGVWGELPNPYGGYFRSPGVDINTTALSKRIVETGQAHYDTAYNDQLIPDMRERSVSIGIEPIKDSFGQVIALFSVGRSVTAGAWTDTGTRSHAGGTRGPRPGTRGENRGDGSLRVLRVARLEIPDGVPRRHEHALGGSGETRGRHGVGFLRVALARQRADDDRLGERLVGTQPRGTRGRIAGHRGRGSSHPDGPLGT